MFNIHTLLILNISLQWYTNKVYKINRPAITLKQLFVVIIFMPFIEEAVFRYHLFSFLRDYMDLIYIKIISSIIFGLIHLTNQWYTPDLPKIKIVIQTMMASLMGWILADYASQISMSFCLHSYYNAVCMFFVWLVVPLEKEFVWHNYISQRRASWPKLYRKPNIPVAIRIRGAEANKLYNEMSSVMRSKVKGEIVI